METKEEKLKEIQKVQAEMDKLQAELDRLNAKVKSNEKLSEDENKCFGQLSWLSALAVTIAAIASTV